MAYHPATEAFYIPLTLNCQRGIYAEVEQVEGGGGGGLATRENLHHPASEGNLGEFMAMTVGGEILWSHRQRTPFNSASLTTAGALALVGDWDRFVRAYDVHDGEVL